jgi:hypothetical protein
VRLICAHCETFDRRPLSSIPAGWAEIVPQPGSIPTTDISHTTACGTVADTFGICPACQQNRKIANLTVAPPPDAAMLF